MSSRLTVANMAVEIGAKFGLFDADEVTEAYLGERGVEGSGPLAADPGASYEAVHDVFLSDLDPQVALPNEVDRVAPVGDVAGQPVEQAFIGSCTNGRLEDLEEAARILEGRQVAPGVRLIVAPASRQVLQEASARGILDTIIAAGASVLPSGCGPCFGGHGGLLGAGERAIGTHNRNFVGRMGSAQAEIYLASPATVAASAVAGHIEDPRSLVAAGA